MLIIRESRSSKLYESFANSSIQHEGFACIRELNTVAVRSQGLRHGFKRPNLKTISSEKSPSLEGLLLPGTLRVLDLGLWRSEANIFVPSKIDLLFFSFSLSRKDSLMFI